MRILIHQDLTHQRISPSRFLIRLYKQLKIQIDNLKSLQMLEECSYTNIQPSHQYEDVTRLI